MSELFGKKSNEVSGVLNYIDQLIREGRARLVPQRLRGRPEGWNGFYVDTGEFVGYEFENNSINLDREVGSVRGSYEILRVGPAGRILFENKVGLSESSQFMVIRCETGSKMKMGFIIK